MNRIKLNRVNNTKNRVYSQDESVVNILKDFKLTDKRYSTGDINGIWINFILDKTSVKELLRNNISIILT